MGVDKKTGFMGIVTNTADLQAPPGALERACNVVIRRAGACETRPGIIPGTTLANTNPPIRIIPYESETVLANDNSEWWNVNDNMEIAYPDPGTGVLNRPPFFRWDLIPSAQTRGNLYTGTGVGVVKFDGVPDSVFGSDLWITTGIPLLVRAFQGAIINPGWLPTASWVAYSVVLVKTDANGLVTRSRPTGAIYVTNNTGTGANVEVFTTAPYPSRLYDKIEIYRTRTFPTSVTPDAEMQLVGVVTPTSTVTTYLDTIPDANRGAALYTSPSREGAEGANDRAPACGALAVFKGALFCGNTIGPYRAIESFTWRSTAITGSATGIGQRAYTGTVAGGSTSMTAVSSTVGLQRGMIITGPNLNLGGVTWITNISGATITMNLPAAGAATTSYTFSDAISVNGGTTWAAIQNFQATGDALDNFSVVTYRISPPVGGFNNTWVFETVTPGVASTPLAIMATHGDEYDPPLPLYGGTPYAGKQDTDPNRLCWSKPDEPEHFPPVNFAFVGDKKRAILSLVSTRDALYIFKEDGIWRLTGIDGQYRIDPFDLTTHCVLPGSVVPLKNRIYMLANRGVVSVSDAEGVQIVSAPIAEQLNKIIYDLQRNSLGGYFLGDLGYPGAAVERDNEYLLLVGDTLQNEQSGIRNGAIVYNEDTQTWVSWEFSKATFNELSVYPRTWSFHERRGTLMLGQGSLNSQQLVSFAPPRHMSDYATDKAWGADATTTMSITTIAGNTITYSPPTDLAVGDVIGSGSGFASYVVAINSAIQVVVANATGFATGFAEIFRPIQCRVRPRAWMTPTEAMKQWTDVTAAFSYLVGTARASVGAVSSINTGTEAPVETPAALDLSSFGTADYRLGFQLRTWLPVAAARGYRLIADVAWAGAWGGATLESIMVETHAGKTNVKNLAVTP